MLIEYTDSVLESENFLEIDYLLLKHVLTQEKLAVTEVKLFLRVCEDFITS